MSAAVDRGAGMAAVTDHDPPVAAVTAPLPSAIRARRFRRSALVLLVQALILIAFLAFWEFEAGKSKQSAFMFGSPSAIWSFLWKMILDGSLARDISVTGLETLLGFLIGNLIGTFVGLSLWYSLFVSRVVQPFVIAIGSIPIIALAPIIIIWFGTGLASKIAMSTLSVVVVALVTSYKGAVGVDPDQINLLRTLGARKPQIFSKLVVPGKSHGHFRRAQAHGRVRVDRGDRRRVHVLVGGAWPRDLPGRIALCDPESVRFPGRHHLARLGADLRCGQDRAVAHPLASSRLIALGFRPNVLISPLRDRRAARPIHEFPIRYNLFTKFRMCYTIPTRPIEPRVARRPARRRRCRLEMP